MTGTLSPSSTAAEDSAKQPASVPAGLFARGAHRAFNH